MDVNDFRDILYEKEADTGIVQVTLNNPRIKNALSAYTFQELYWATEALEADDGAMVMIITGARDPDNPDPAREAFSSGGNFDPAVYESLSEEVKAQMDLTDIAQKKITLKMWQLEKPVIVAMNGLAVGGAFTLALAWADLVYASEHAWATLPFVGLGIIPELASSYLLPRMIGFQRAKEIMYFGEKLTARDLHELGLVNRVLPHDELLPYAREAALRLIPPRGAPLAVKRTKRALHQPLLEAVNRALDLENEGLNINFGTEDFREAVTARIERRPPVFKGR